MASIGSQIKNNPGLQALGVSLGAVLKITDKTYSATPVQQYDSLSRSCEPFGTMACIDSIYPASTNWTESCLVACVLLKKLVPF